MSEAIIAAQTAIARQNFAVSTFKTANDQVKQLANIIDQNARTVSANASRGTNVNFNA
jgi:hypothetical protein